ncbi:AAA family ATPase [uncultured Cyclobacterium sp.]|uniref:AAA family ATPase n=1 Tax=uncultured Cyclobacterium sp. TaxID=453820 RepID=UPI0030EE9B9D
MDITIPRNKIHNRRQTIQVDNTVLTFVGQNGSGKSALLESIFQKYLDDQASTTRVISFTSGFNECYSSQFNKSVKSRKRFVVKNPNDETRIDNAINAFFFDSSWVRFLVFAACALKPRGKVAEFLNTKNLISHDANGIDTSTYIKFPFRVRYYYIKRIQNALAREATDPSFLSVRRTFFHDYLTKVAEAVYSSNYEFDDSIIKDERRINAKDLLNILGNDINKIFSFLAWSSSKDDFIFRKEAKLFFGRIELNDLSDGEYQLLSIFSLLDLFDDSDTIFLFDEVDSHLYYQNVQKLWSCFENISGKIITTTHSADSIILNDFNNIKLVENGQVVPTLLADTILKRLESLASGLDYKMQVAGKVRYIALVEDYFDWFIFKELSRIKVPNFDPTVFDRIHYIKCPSNWDQTSQEFGGAKVNWVEDFKKQNTQPDTHKIFLLCDRDNLPIADIGNSGLVNRAPNRQNRIPIPGQGGNRMAFLLSWKRREIENYLLSHTMLTNHTALQPIQNLLPPNDQLAVNNSNDNENVRRLDVKTALQPLYLKDNITGISTTQRGVDFNKLKTIIDEIPASEISEDITNLYNFFSNNL